MHDLAGRHEIPNGEAIFARLVAVRGVVPVSASHVTVDETPAQAVEKALAFWGHPPLSRETIDNLIAFSSTVEHEMTAAWEQVDYRIVRQNALRILIPTTPEWQAV